MNMSYIPKSAMVAINDMLDCCAKIRPGQEVVILAFIDGLYGGDNLVDNEAISWIHTSVQMRGANSSILWIDEPAKIHEWRVPPIVAAAMEICDVLINNTFDLVTEENLAFRKLTSQRDLRMVRNFATTAPLLCTAWAQTPYELVEEIRYQASIPFKGGLPWKLNDKNGTCLEGTIAPEMGSMFSSSGLPLRRQEWGHYLPWPEWVSPPVTIENTSGIFIFDRMLSWWSRYIGISPYFSNPIRLTVENCRITKIEGGDEAFALDQFLKSQSSRLGDGVYDFKGIHFGVHPQAIVEQYQCPHILWRRLIDHSHSSNIHVHIGAPPPTKKYPYWMHCTGDIRTATFSVDDALVHDRGHLTALDHPAVREIAAKYPNRPGIEPNSLAK